MTKPIDDNRFLSMGNLKQALTKDYNKVNAKIFSTGVISLKIDIFQDKIFMLASYKRLAALNYLSKENIYASVLADYHLIDSFKKEMKTILVNDYGFNIVSIFKDYDADAELSSTVIVLTESVDGYLN